MTDLAISSAFKQLEAELSICTSCHHVKDESQYVPEDQCVNPECHEYMEIDRELDCE